NLGRAQAELRVFAAARRPATRAFGQQPRANAQQRFNAHLPGHRNNLPQRLELLDDHDDAFAELADEPRPLDELSVLVAVANDEAAALILQRQTREQF